MGKGIAQKLFSYGTLQLKNVQKETFGRNLVGEKDILLGYKLENLKIKDPSVLEISETKTHPIIRFTGIDQDIVQGTVFEVSSDELIEADNYEVEDYKRIEVILKSGIKSWVYTAKWFYLILHLLPLYIKRGKGRIIERLYKIKAYSTSKIK